MKNVGLWKKIESVELDAVDAQLPFSKRVMRENSWTLAYAEQVILEYKRFVYLAMVSDTPVTPSDAVDQVWHLHLVYTEHYWGEFTKAIGGALHHGPTKGGAQENHRYREQYQFTLDQYVEEFSEPAPSTIWPNVEERFANPGQFERVNTTEYWLVPKPSFSVGQLAAGSTGLGIAGLFVAGFAFANTSVQPQNAEQNDYFTLALLALVVAFGVFAVLRSILKSRKSKDRSSSGCGSNGIGCGSGCGGCGG